MEDHDSSILLAIQQNVGRPPRRFYSWVRKYTNPVRPAYANPPDLIARIYDHYNQSLRRGVPRWAAIVQANFTVYEPGSSTSGGQVVYCEDDISLEELIRIAKTTAATKHNTPSDPAVNKIAAMLTDDMERALDWPLPRQLAGEHSVYTTIVQIDRAQVPDGFVGLDYFPVLADPETKYAVLVPGEYWPEPLIRRWLNATEDRRQYLRSHPVVKLTPFGADAAKTIAIEQSFESWHLHVGIKVVGKGYQYVLDISEKQLDPNAYIIYQEQGLTIAIPSMDAVYLRGTTIDYKDEPNAKGFMFHNPRAER